MNNRLIFLAMLFTVLYGIAGEIDKYPRYKQFMEIKTKTVIPLPLVFDRYYVRLAKKDALVDGNMETGKLSIKDGSLYAEVIHKYSSEIMGTDTGIFNYFEPGKSLVGGERAINTFMDGYRQLNNFNDDEKKVIYMELMERLDGAGTGGIIKKMSEDRSFVIDKAQVNAIAALLEAEKTSKVRIAFFKKLLCGAGLFAFVVVCCCKLFVNQ